MRAAGPRLSDKIRIQILYEDKTPFGSALSGIIDDRVRDCCRDIIDVRRSRRMSELVAHSNDLLGAAYRSGGLRNFYHDPRALHEDCLFPPRKLVQPSGLLIERDGKTTSIPLATEVARDLAHWFGEWCGSHARPTGGAALCLWQALEDAGGFENDAEEPGIGGDVIFVGHATALYRAGEAGILIDPFLLPRSAHYPPSYQPMTAAELGQIDAIFITHSHPDHYDLGSLFRFGADMPIRVPAVERESILSIDMAFRLEQLGFTQVRRMRWFDEAMIGGVRVIALPFYGEQPTSGRRYHPEVRNIGNTYLVEAGSHRVAFVADSGCDDAGNVKVVAADARKKFGPLNLLFGTHRGFSLYPLQFLFSSVARHLLFVPSEAWTTRQQVMNDAHDLLDTAEIWGASHTIPYACGGAPWYWERGLGPRPPSLGGRSPWTDPLPESTIDAQRTRSDAPEGTVASPASVFLLRPGESVDIGPGDPVVRRGATHLWPYGLQHRPHECDLDLLLRGGEDIPVVRKKVLLTILAAAEAERRGVSPTVAEVQAMADRFRIGFGLLQRRDLDAWMAVQGLDAVTFVAKMREFALVEKLGEFFTEQIDEALPAALRINTARDFLNAKPKDWYN